jgi:hypothetical protein
MGWGCEDQRLGHSSFLKQENCRQRNNPRISQRGGATTTSYSSSISFSKTVERACVIDKRCNSYPSIIRAFEYENEHEDEKILASWREVLVLSFYLGVKSLVLGLGPGF